MPVPLHVHSWYSLLEGVAGPEALVDHAAACGYTALALTDTNNLYGAMKFVERAHHQGIRPILGASLCQGESRCVVLIAEQVGYRNLCRIISRLHLGTGGRGQGSEVSPALPTTHYPLSTLLAENADGLHVLTGDLALAGALREAFGSRLWLEVVRPAASKRREQELLEGGRRLGLKPVASTAAHFLAPAEHRIYRLATAVRQTTLLDQLPTAGLNPAARITPEHYLVDPATLRQRFRDLPEAVRNTDALAEQLCSEVLLREVVLPPARVPRRLDAVRYLHLLWS